MLQARQRLYKWEKNYQFDVLMAFWLAIHKGCLDVTKYFIIFDIYMR
jgi:hypothetical protein